MRAEFFRPDDTDAVVASADWDGVTVHLHADEAPVRESLDRIFRPSPVPVTDASTRPAGATGQTVVEPGDLQWFISAARVRGEAEGLGVRFVSHAPGGWDPAGAYRPMGVWVARREHAGQTTGTLGTPSQ